MQKTYFFPFFLLCLFLVILIFIFGNFGLLGFVPNSIQAIIFPLSSWAKQETRAKDNAKIASLQKENLALAEKLVHLQQLEEDNAALHDQFQTTYPVQNTLLPVQVVSSNFPQTLIVAAGVEEYIHTGMIVVVGANALGQITRVASQYSQVQLITNTSSSQAVKDMATGALGVIQGSGNGDMLVGNILLSDSVQKGDTIVTLGSQNLSGSGYPPNLILGKVVSMQKDPTSLFQQARVVPLVDMTRLTTVFILRPHL